MKSITKFARCMNILSGGQFRAGIRELFRPPFVASVLRHNFCGLLTAGILGVAMVGCGGDGGGGGGDGGAIITPPLAPMIDSFGQPVPESFGGGDSAAAGADGTSGDGAPIPNAPVRIVDNSGRSVSATTDAQGYYRARIDGLTPPFIASVTRADGVVWYSPSISPVISRTFITINLNGLTDKIASDLAVAAGRNGAAQLTTAMLAANPASLQAAKAKLNADYSGQIIAAGLNPASFDAVQTPFRAVVGQPYDNLLESLQISKNSNGSTTVTPLYSLGGTVSGLGGHTGLSIGNGSETLTISSAASTFTFATLVAQGSPYNVVVRAQPLGATCAVSNGSGTMAGSAVTQIAIVCSTNTFTLGGSVSGLSSASGLVLTNSGQTVTVAPNATSFIFPNPIPQGANYSVSVSSQPAGRSCSVSNGTGIIGGAPVTSVAVVCSTNSYQVGGTLSGLTSNGLVLTTGGQTITVAINATTFAFFNSVASGAAYNVTVQTQPVGLVCTVSNGSGTVVGSPITNIAVACTSAGSFTLGGTATGHNSPMTLSTGSQTVFVFSGTSGALVTFVFPTPVVSGTNYNVSVQNPPLGQTCIVTNGSGTMPSSSVNNILISCN